MIDEQPVIGMLACPAGQSDDMHDLETQTVAALTELALLVPVIIPATLGNGAAQMLASRLDALIVYGLPSKPDGLVTAMILAATNAARPVFATGGGFLALNAAFGGADERSSATSSQGKNQKLRTAAGSVLQRFTASATLLVGPSSCQPIRTLGEGLVANATDENGVIAVISAAHTAAPVLGLNWHPEREANNAPHDAAFWHFVGEAARATYLAAPASAAARPI